MYSYWACIVTQIPNANINAHCLGIIQAFQFSPLAYICRDISDEMCCLHSGPITYLNGSDLPLKTTYGFTLFGDGKDICLGAWGAPSEKAQV